MRYVLAVLALAGALHVGFDALAEGIGPMRGTASWYHDGEHVISCGYNKVPSGNVDTAKANRRETWITKDFLKADLVQSDYYPIPTHFPAIVSSVRPPMMYSPASDGNQDDPNGYRLSAAAKPKVRIVLLGGNRNNGPSSVDATVSSQILTLE